MKFTQYSKNLKMTKLVISQYLCLKKCAPFISEHLSQFLNSFIRLGIFPQKLKVGKVSPIFKKGDVQLFDNYRPISVLPIFLILIYLFLVKLKLRLMKMHRLSLIFFKFKTYFTSVVPTALLLQWNWPITGIRRVL